MSDTLNIETELTFDASAPDGEIDFSHSEFKERVGDGFNEHGVRENYDDNDDLESVDVIYEAMEPGPPEDRNGVRITESFLDKVASHDYEGTPHLKDHNDKDSWSKIGEVQDTWYSDRLNKLLLMTRTPNIEGSRNHQEAISRYSYDPPSIRDGSLGFGNNYEAKRNADGEPEMVTGRFREFSAVNFPGGYDEGGVGAAFSEAVEELELEFDDSDESGENSATEFAVTTETYQL